MDVAERSEGSAVNPHYLDHVVAVGERHPMEASEDIVAGNGLKLLARGARVDARMRERLLEHKLRKPLENCLRACDGVEPQEVARTADALLDQHAMLRALYADSPHLPVDALMHAYAACPPLQTLFTVYARHGQRKLEHTVSVSLLAMGLVRRLAPHDHAQAAVMLLAGLFHDVGELYIDPALLARGVSLPAQQWRHVAAHPIVSHRVLSGMRGVSRAAAHIVLHHHERLDGYGYPHGTSGAKLVVDCQVVAVAEMLSGLLENGRAPLMHADVALRLIPGEFNRGLVDLVSAARRTCEAEEVRADCSEELARALARVGRIATLAERVARARAAVSDELAAASDAFKDLLRHAERRLNAILRAFSSTGLDAPGAAEMIGRLEALGDAAMTLEFTLIVREVVWRLNELERELTLRVQVLTPQDAPLLAKLLAAIRERQLH